MVQSFRAPGHTESFMAGYYKATKAFAAGPYRLPRQQCHWRNMRHLCHPKGDVQYCCWPTCPAASWSKDAEQISHIALRTSGLSRALAINCSMMASMAPSSPKEQQSSMCVLGCTGQPS